MMVMQPYYRNSNSWKYIRNYRRHSDPDGTGTLSYSWQSSSDNSNSGQAHHPPTHSHQQKKGNIYRQLSHIQMMTSESVTTNSVLAIQRIHQ